jgi:hypothetical protein
MALFITAGGYLIACSSDEGTSFVQPVPVGPIPRSNILLSSACTHSPNPLNPGSVSARCAEMNGTTTTITMSPPPITPVPVQYYCTGWGLSASPPYPPNEWVQSFIGRQFSIFSNRPTYATVQMVDAVSYVFQVTPQHPTSTAVPAVNIVCHIDPNTTNGTANINIAVNGTVPVTLTAITISGANYWLRQPQTVTSVPSYKDNYNGTDLLVPIPATTWTAASTPVGAIVVSSGGVVSATARGTAVITAHSGTINSNSITLTSSGCSSVALSAAGPFTLTTGGTTTSTATPTCDPGITASTEPITWTAMNASVATVTMSGTGNHVGTIHAIGAGTTTVKACGVNLPGPPCSALVTVTVQAPVYSVAISGPSIITSKATYTYTAVPSAAFSNPSFAWTERFCDGPTCSNWVSVSGPTPSTITRVLNKDCSGTGNKEYQLTVVVTGGGTATAQKNSALCQV